jgi:hypothetical protein
VFFFMASMTQRLEVRWFVVMLVSVLMMRDRCGLIAPFTKWGYREFQFTDSPPFSAVDKPVLVRSFCVRLFAPFCLALIADPVAG